MHPVTDVAMPDYKSHDISLSMAHQDRPRVKLPDHIIRKPVTPGPNSWAQAQQQQYSENYPNQNFRVTNRDKYEDKPMPPPPLLEEASPPRTILPQKPYIQPAIPLTSQVPSRSKSKNRAVTDPVAPKPLFASRKTSVTQLGKKFSASKSKGETCKDNTRNESEPTATGMLCSEKPAQVLGLYPAQDNKRNTPPTSAPNPIIPDPFRISYEGPDEQVDTSARQVQSTPVPTRRYLTENGLPTPTLMQPSDASASNETGPRKQDQTSNNDARSLRDGLLHPPKVGTFGNVGDVGVIQENRMQRYESFRGIIETVSPTKSHGENKDTASIDSQLTTGRSQDTGLSLASEVYTPGDYRGVWENDPAVVSTTNSYSRA